MNENWLYSKYWAQENSFKEFSKEIGVCAQTVLNYMKKYNIPHRSCTKPSKRTLELQLKLKLANAILYLA